jgi:hypothetical protein
MCGLSRRACPVAAIGTTRELLARTPADGFPALITGLPAGQVHHGGWASRRSFGASSWLITRRHADGRPDNVLIDAPPPVARAPSPLGAGENHGHGDARHGPSADAEQVMKSP